MMNSSARPISAGVRVKVKEPCAVPPWSTWDNDGHRTSNSVKRRLQQLFFKGDRRITAAVVYIASETERVRLKRANRVKVELRDPAGSSIIITACAKNLRTA